MKYNIKWCENITTSTGKNKMNAELIDEQGKSTTNVSIWADFPNFSTLMNGHNVEGDLVPAKDPKYGPTLYPPKPQTTFSGAPRGSGGVSRMMDKKDERIEKHTENKEHAIKEASSMSNAVQLAIAEYGTWTGDDHLRPELDFLISKYRKWILDHWDVPLNLKPPF